MAPLFVLVFIGFMLLGCLLGTITGLIPGLHVNNVSVILLSAVPFILAFLSPLTVIGLRSTDITVLIAIAIVSLGITHTFLDFIPSAFLGAPEGDTALSVLPAHKMLLEGRGYEAVYISAVGSFLAIIFGFVILVPYRFIFGTPIGLYMHIKNMLLYILSFIVIVLILTENGRIRYRKYIFKGKTMHGYGPYSRTLAILSALVVFLVSGIFGLMVLSMVPQPIIPVTGATTLFPALSGAFGIATIYDSLRHKTQIPPQDVKKPDIKPVKAMKSAFVGTVAGSIVGFLPGMTSAQATVLAMLGQKERVNEDVILMLSAINTANTFFVTVAMFLILKARSGAAIVVMELIDIDEWRDVLMPQTLTLMLVALIIAASIAFFITIFIGKKAAIIFSKLDYRKVSIGIIMFVVIMVFLFTGPLGLLVLLTSTLIGLIPPTLGIRRTHMMGMLILPVMLYLWG